MPILSDQQLLAVAAEHERAGRFRDAEVIYRSLFARYPGSADLCHAIGLVAHRCGRHAEARAWLEHAIGIDGSQPYYYSNLGTVLHAMGEAKAAIACWAHALRQDPRLKVLHYNIGRAHLDLSQWDAAIDHFQKVIEYAPTQLDAYLSLGNAWLLKGEPAAAVGVYRVAVILLPEHSSLWGNLGIALQANGQWEESLAAYREALQRNPKDARVVNNLGDSFLELGECGEAIACFRQAITLRPELATAHSNLIFATLFQPETTVDEIAEESHFWWVRHGEPLAPRRPQFSGTREPERRLRVGYVSADLREHPVGRHIAAFLPLLDRSQAEIVLYSDARSSPDPITKRLQACGATWRDIGTWSDDRLAGQIREDAIDVLVDLSLHSAGNRLLVFSRWPAPVQVSFGGYPGSTGVETIEYRITDRFLEPEEEASPWVGTPLRLRDSFWCYGALDGDVPVNALPALASGEFVFGCLSKTAKLNRKMLGCWSEILRRVPNSRLLLLCPPGTARDRLIAAFESEGIAASRIRFSDRLPRREYLALYNQIDLVVDSYPYNGHVTTCDALWMGVPVVTLAGQTPVSRGGLSILSNIGLPELAAYSLEEYVGLAAALANDLPRLAQLRLTLRDRMRTSPLMDVERYARSIEEAIRSAWRRRCVGEPPQEANGGAMLR